MNTYAKVAEREFERYPELIDRRYKLPLSDSASDVDAEFKHYRSLGVRLIAQIVTYATAILAYNLSTLSPSLDMCDITNILLPALAVFNGAAVQFFYYKGYAKQAMAKLKYREAYSKFNFEEGADNEEFYDFIYKGEVFRDQSNSRFRNATRFLFGSLTFTVLSLLSTVITQLLRAGS